MVKNFKLKKLTNQLVLAGVMSVALPVMAEEAASTAQENLMMLSPVVVTATRVEQNSFDLPVSIDVVDAEKIQEGQLQVNISESLARVPGIVAEARGHYAQDIQISTRGFGARSAFGVRGIRLYADGIPLTMPDGQGQAGTFDLGSAKSIEVMRGPFSALYGNSSGGVVQIFTADGPKDPTVSGSFTTGSYGTNRESVKVGGTNGSFNYNVDYSHLESDGYRDHSAVRKDLFNAKLGFQLNEDTRLTVLATYMDQPLAQDPQGLTVDQLRLNPKMADIKTSTFDTRVSRSQSQIGAKLEHDFNVDNTISLMGYGGLRDNLQFQSTYANSKATGFPAGTAINIKGWDNYYYDAGHPNGSAGGVVQIKRDFGGADLRFTHKGALADGPYSVTVGANFDTMTDGRTSYDNFIANPSLIAHSNIAKNYTCGTTVTCGVIGILRRDEDNTAWNFDQYVQAEWSPVSRLNLVAGIRHNDVHLKSEDHFIKNGDGSGGASFSKTTPVVGALFKLNDMVNLYANVGKGFETPSLVEVAYLPDGTGGFNSNLQPATSNNYEVGTKAFIGANTRATLAVFKTDTQHEIVVAQNLNGRSSYQNAGGTKRNGVELTVDSDFGKGFAGYASYAYLDAKYSDSFCSGTTAATSASCTGTGVAWVNGGKIIPGTYRQTAYAELSWKHTPTGFSTAVEARGVGKIYVSDKVNDNASGYALLNWRGGFAQNLNKWRIAEFLRIENIFDRNYVGSVKVNDSSSQFYEPGANRNWLLGVNAAYSFR